MTKVLTRFTELFHLQCQHNHFIHTSLGATYLARHPDFLSTIIFGSIQSHSQREQALIRLSIILSNPLHCFLILHAHIRMTFSFQDIFAKLGLHPTNPNPTIWELPFYRFRGIPAICSVDIHAHEVKFVKTNSGYVSVNARLHSYVQYCPITPCDSHRASPAKTLPMLISSAHLESD